MKTGFSLLFLFCFFQSTGQISTVDKPKLVVGIVVDQMRWDFLYRFSNRYGYTGFKRLLNEGFSCENTFINFIPTYTAPGHASVYTGAVSSLHGIVGNDWYNKYTQNTMYCTSDSAVSSIGSTSNAGKMSPKNLWSSTFTDELRMATNFRNKTIAIALKDRGSILPGGHTANAAYWFDNSTGGWITSSFYMNTLPQWVIQFNNKKLPDLYLKQNWNTLYPLNTYLQSTEDNKNFESILPGGTNIFPHKTEDIIQNKYESFRYTPGGNTYTFEFAKAAIENEKLGNGEYPDVLAISFSSPDYIGHRFGPNSVEIEDMYLRLDKELGDFLSYLDGKIGKESYLLFLTSDHGVAHIPAFVNENKMPGSTDDDAKIKTQINQILKQKLNINNAITYIINSQIYLSDSALNDHYHANVKKIIKEELLNHPSISHVFYFEEMHNLPLPQRLKIVAENGYNAERSGDIQIIYKPQRFNGWTKGTTHGAWNPYDSHIPLIWYGWKVKQGRLHREVFITDIAVTVAAMLRIQMPNAATGTVITELLSN
jgi:predicted AlkP superfamily pyrophosphatase or phosphodiesterase